LTVTEEQARQVVASQTEYFACTEAELVKLMHAGIQIHAALGSGALIWEKGEKCPEAIVALGRMRGVFNENVAGDGI
jgi:hypothetical protein